MYAKHTKVQMALIAVKFSESSGVYNPANPYIELSESAIVHISEGLAYW